MSRAPSVANCRSSCEERHVVREGLAEPESGIDGHQVPAHTGGLGRGHPLGEEGADLGDDVPVAGRALHRRRARPACASGTPVRGVRPRRRGHPVRRSARTSLIMLAPARTAARITSGRDVSTDRGTPVTRARRSTTGTTRSSSSSTVGGSRTGPRRLAADVDQVGALAGQVDAVGGGTVVVEEAATVGERVRGDVQDPAHEGARRAQDRGGRRAPPARWRAHRVRVGQWHRHLSALAPVPLSTTRAASRRATGIRNGEQET